MISSIFLGIILLVSSPLSVRAVGDCFETNIELRSAIQDYLSQTTSSGRRQTDAAEKYGYPMGTWCVSRLDDFSYVFFGAKFNGLIDDETLGNWDTRNAITMEGMFKNSDYDGDLSDWDTVRLLCDALL